MTCPRRRQHRGRLLPKARVSCVTFSRVLLIIPRAEHLGTTNLVEISTRLQPLDAVSVRVKFRVLGGSGCRNIQDYYAVGVEMYAIVCSQPQARAVILWRSAVLLHVEDTLKEWGKAGGKRWTVGKCRISYWYLARFFVLASVEGGRPSGLAGCLG